MFDVSHLGTVRIEGPGSLARLQSVLTNDLTKVTPGRAQYTHLLEDSDASVADDIIVWWLDDEVFDVMPNASNTSRVIGAIGGSDTTDSRAVIAVQGPRAREVVSSVSRQGSDTGRFRVTKVHIDGVECTVAGTGYTGEDGVEIAVPRDAATTIWNRLRSSGAVPAGLGARDTLRLEAGLPLHGHELGPGITPLQAGLGWVVAWDKPLFRGREALHEERRTGPRRLLTGLSIEGRRPARDGSTVLNGEGQPIGTVSSGNFSPTLGHCIAMAFLPPGTPAGTAVGVDVRGSVLPAVVCRLPFVEKKK
jgi:aminomethyltransferase